MSESISPNSISFTMRVDPIYPHLKIEQTEDKGGVLSLRRYSIRSCALMTGPVFCEWAQHLISQQSLDSLPEQKTLFKGSYLKNGESCEVKYTPSEVERRAMDHLPLFILSINAGEQSVKATKLVNEFGMGISLKDIHNQVIDLTEV